MMNELFKEFILGLITLVGTALSMCVIKLLSAKINAIMAQTTDDKKIAFLEWVESEIIIKCIQTTNQTYVQSLKNSNKFDKEAQKEAMNKTITSVLALLTDANSELLSSYVGDITTWITTCIENYIISSKE